MGLLSDEIYSVMIPNSPCKENQQQIPMKSNVTQEGLEREGFFNSGFFTSKNQTSECENPEELFTSLQYSFFTNSGVEVLGGILFLAQGSLKVLISIYPYLEKTPNFSRFYKKLGPFYKKLRCDKFGNLSISTKTALNNQIQSSMKIYMYIVC